MDDCTGYIGLCMPAFMTACMMLASMLVMLTIAIQKNWFTVRKKRAMCGIWAGFLAMPVAAFLIRYLSSSLTEYQICTFTGCFSGGGEEDYFTEMLHSFWQQNKWIGKSGSDVMGNLPAFNADYILTYLSSVYGTIAAILLCCVLAVLIFAVFNTAMRQKNQLGMMMGCGCGIVFPYKLFYKYPGKSGHISTISNISSLFISRRKLHYSFLWTDGDCTEYIQI